MSLEGRDGSLLLIARVSAANGCDAASETLRQKMGAPAVRQESEVSDSHEPARQYVEKKPAQEPIDG